MHGIYYRLLIIVTIRMPMESNDIGLRCVRTLPFAPMEGTTLVIANEQDEEHEILLGAPRYEFAESAFVEYQEDESLLELLREGNYTSAVRDELVNYYTGFGFARANPVQPAREPV